MAPQPEVSGILYEKTLPADHLYDEPNILSEYRAKHLHTRITHTHIYIIYY